MFGKRKAYPALGRERGMGQGWYGAIGRLAVAALLIGAVLIWRAEAWLYVDVPLEHADVIVVDPPRKGCDQVCLETIVKMKPERVVYVSCDSATLARDLRYLVDEGYEVEKVRGCDMFPGSGHVESIVLLQKKSNAK